jgi:cytochrome c553
MFPSILQSFSPRGRNQASLALLCCSLASTAAEYQDPRDAGLPLALACAGCHGTDGRSRSEIPSIAARPEAEFAALMRGFRDGQRPATVMNRIAKGYDDGEIALLAAYFAKR